MWYRVAADFLVLLHLAFVFFVVFGGLFVWRWPRIAWIHVPAAAWGALIEFQRWICPLTPLENHFRRGAGERGYEGGFIEHYIIPVVYPAGLTPHVQTLLGTAIVALNVLTYGMYLSKGRRRSG